MDDESVPKSAIVFAVWFARPLGVLFSFWTLFALDAPAWAVFVFGLFIGWWVVGPALSLAGWAIAMRTIKE